MKKTMEEYINETSAVMLHNIENRDELIKPIISRLCSNPSITTLSIVASGSSYNAALSALAFMRAHLPWQIELITPFEFTYYGGTGRNREYLFISQSGNSTNTLEAVRSANDRGIHTTLLTGNADSSIAQAADDTILYGVGEESVGYVTKGVSTLTLFLMLLALEYPQTSKSGSIGRGTCSRILEQLTSAAINHQNMYKWAQYFCESNRSALLNMNHILIISCGRNMGTAREGALKISEMTHVQTSVYEIEEFLHGPDLQLTPEYTLFFIEGGDSAGKRVREVYEAIRVITPHAFLITPDAELLSTQLTNQCASALVQDKAEVHLTKAIYSPLYLTAAFQYIAYWVAKELNITGEHPLYARFEEIIQCKTDLYTEDSPF